MTASEEPASARDAALLEEASSTEEAIESDGLDMGVLDMGALDDERLLVLDAEPVPDPPQAAIMEVMPSTTNAFIIFIKDLNNYC
ncbi:hypothetical protein [Cellvibrio fontiphilus]|uniref:Uncharacterized protein n=1 Tax=Cellvibrio fontiphilus TaxID=1815559 RepID=A0ABV7FG16_9GAMM